MIGSPFLATVKLFVPKVPLASTITTSSPTAGDAGRVTVKTPPVVFAKIWSPGITVTFAVTVVYPLVLRPL